MDGLDKYAGQASSLITPELIAYAKSLYPNICPSTIERNDIELAYAMQFEHQCEAVCMGLQHCPSGTKGLHPVATGMRPDGWIEWAFSNCKYLGDWKYNRRNNAAST